MRIKIFNPAAEKITNFSAEEAILTFHLTEMASFHIISDDMAIFLSLTLIFLASIAVVPNVSASPISLPLDHWSYHFIERLQAKGALRDLLSSVDPLLTSGRSKLS